MRPARHKARTAASVQIAHESPDPTVVRLAVARASGSSMYSFNVVGERVTPVTSPGSTRSPTTNICAILIEFAMICPINALCDAKLTVDTVIFSRK